MSSLELMAPETNARSSSKPTRASLSALIIARDEAANLEACLSTLDWVDETIVVVDRRSRDRTLEIAQTRASVVVVREFDDFASQRNAGLARATGDWILSIDADERVTPRLREAMERVLRERRSVPRAYRIPIRSVVLGRSFGYSGTQHDLPTRFFRRDSAYWTGLVHETLNYTGEVGTLDGALSHRTIPDMQTFLRKINEYTTLEARAMAASGQRFRRRDMLVRPLWIFLKLFLAKQGFRDGLEGLVFCGMSGVSVAARSWKLRELLRGEEER